MSTSTKPDVTALVRAYSIRLYRYFTANRVASAEAHDLVQSTFEVFLAKPQGTIEDVDRYLWGIAHNKLRHARRTRTFEEFPQSQVAGSTTALSQKVDRRLRVTALLDRLGEEEREIFLMRCEGLTIEQIAAAVDRGPATVKRRLADARRQIDAIAGETPTPEGTLGVEDVEDSYRTDGA